MTGQGCYFPNTLCADVNKLKTLMQIEVSNGGTKSTGDASSNFHIRMVLEDDFYDKNINGIV